MITRMHTKLIDQWIAGGCGLVVGVWTWVGNLPLLNIKPAGSSLMETAIAAALAGAAGIAGKEVYVLLRRSLKSYFITLINKRKNGRNN